MKYIELDTVELSKENDEFVNAVAQCMLQLLSNRLCKEDNSDLIIDEKSDIDFDFSMYGKELLKMRDELGYSSEKIIELADSYVRGL